MAQARPFNGSWEQDGQRLRINGAAGLSLSGWGVDGDSTIAAARLFIDDRLWSTAEVCTSRPDVVQYLADIVEPGTVVPSDCGWTMSVTTAGLEAGRSYRARVEAMTTDGRFFELGVNELEITDDAPTPPADTGDEIRLDLPVAGSRVKTETVEMRGWLDLRSGPLDSVEIEVDGHSVGVARTFLPRPDVAAAKGDPSLFFTGYEFFWTRPVSATRAEITAVATTCSGSTVTSKPSRITLAPLPGPEKPPAVGFFQDRSMPETTGRTGPAGEALQVLVVTHSFAVGGGQLWLAELLEHLHNEGDLNLSVLSLDDGPLMEDLQRDGVDVHITTAPPNGSAEQYECRVQEICSLLERRKPAVLLCNTLGTYFIADAAQRLGIPVLWAIHEHFELAEWWPFRNKQIQGSHSFTCLTNALRAADHLIFESDSTRTLFRDTLGSDNTCTIYYGIDIKAIDAYQQSNPREKFRAELGIPANATLMVVVATFEPRKSQPAIIDSFRRVASRHDDVHLLLVGASDTAYVEGVLALLATPDLDGVPITTAPVSRDIWRYYHAADLLVSGSDIESMPRSFMEAMAFNTPIVTTDVAGCKELVLDAVTGWTTPARTTLGLEMAMERALFNREQWPAYAAAARELLERRHSSSKHGREIATLLRGAVAARVSAGRPPGR